MAVVVGDHRGWLSLRQRWENKQRERKVARVLCNMVFKYSDSYNDQQEGLTDRILVFKGNPHGKSTTSRV